MRLTFLDLSPRAYFSFCFFKITLCPVRPADLPRDALLQTGGVSSRLYFEKLHWLQYITRTFPTDTIISPHPLRHPFALCVHIARSSCFSRSVHRPCTHPLAPSFFPHFSLIFRRLSPRTASSNARWLRPLFHSSHSASLFPRRFTPSSSLRSLTAARPPLLRCPSLSSLASFPPHPPSRTRRSLRAISFTLPLALAVSLSLLRSFIA